MVARAPRKRMYRTMQGRMIDIEKLRGANEDVRAVGNMNVNARGDVLGPGGSIAATKEKVIAKYYEQPRGKVDETPMRSKPTAPRRVAPAPQPKAVESKPAPENVQVKKEQTQEQPKEKTEQKK